MPKKISGIYYILNTSTGQYYIGKSKNIKSRLNNHFSLLRHHAHENHSLQNSFNEYGESAFDKGIIKACKEQYLDRFEKLYIKKYQSTNPYYGFNLVKGNNRWRNNVSPIQMIKPKRVNGILVKDVVKTVGHINWNRHR